jgi:hypothetical protein
MIRAVRAAGCGLALAAVFAGCGREDEGGASSLGTVRVDTANAAPMDGVSDEQLKRQAQALTPEEAAARGVAVDTSIHVENLGSSADSVSSALPATGDAGASGGGAAASPAAPAPRP